MGINIQNIFKSLFLYHLSHKSLLVLNSNQFINRLIIHENFKEMLFKKEYFCLSEYLYLGTHQRKYLLKPRGLQEEHIKTLKLILHIVEMIINLKGEIKIQ